MTDVHHATTLRIDPADGPKTLATYLATIQNDPAECRTVSRRVNPMTFDCTAVLAHLEHRNEYPTVIFGDALNMYGEPSGFPVVMNLWASRERCAEAAGIHRSKSGAELGPLFSEKVKQAIEPVVIPSAEAPVQQNVLRGEDADLWKLPVVRHAELDLGGAFTMALAMKAPDEDFYNITFVKLFAEDHRRGGVTIHSRDMSRMVRLWRERGEPIPTIFILGHHPAFWLGTLNNTPYGDNEYATAGGFLGEAVRLTPSVTWGDKFLVPADAEIIIEGEIAADERTIVDPFGEISRQYQAQETAPLMEVTAITYRDDAIMQDVFSGHREHMLMGSIPREGTVFNHLKEKFGNVTAVNFPFSGVGRHAAYISIKKTEEYQPKQMALAAITHVPNLQLVVIVDDDIDVFREEDVVWAVSTYTIPDRDFDMIRGLRPSSDMRGTDSARILIDATRPTHFTFPNRIRVPQEALDRVTLDEWLDRPTAPRS